MESKFFKSPFFGLAFIAIAMTLYFSLSYLCRAIFGIFAVIGYAIAGDKD